MAVDIEQLREWVGRSETHEDVTTLAPLRALAATLDHSDASWSHESSIPPAWHWLYFLPATRQAEIAPDGHPKRGGFLPPIPLPRRMWAGSRMQFLVPLRPDQKLQRTSRIADVRMKEGRSGPLVFVKVHHEVRDHDLLCIVEEQDLVYREAPAPGAPAPAPVMAPDNASWSRRIVAESVLLFRYSALTFNGHRIHFDREYATDVEGYPGLVVHGPLIATLLLDLLHRQLPQVLLKTFTFRAVNPLFDTAPFQVCGRQEDAETVKLWACTEDGQLAMDATATLY